MHAIEACIFKLRREQEKIPKKRTGAKTLTQCLTARVIIVVVDWSVKFNTSDSTCRWTDFLRVRWNRPNKSENWGFRASLVHGG